MDAVKVNGIEIFIEESENYIQINDIQGQDLAWIWEPLAKQYPGYEVTLCFRDMQPHKDALDAIGAEVLEDCLSLKVTQPESVHRDCPKITLLEKDDFEKFASLHDEINPESSGMYWTSQRIWAKWDFWRIFVIKHDGEITGYGMLMVALRDGAMGEIFCVEADSPGQREALISAMVGCAFDNGKNVVLYTVERDDICRYEAALAVGFREVGYYIGYQVIIPKKMPLTVP